MDETRILEAYSAYYRDRAALRSLLAEAVIDEMRENGIGENVEKALVFENRTYVFLHCRGRLYQRIYLDVPVPAFPAGYFDVEFDEHWRTALLQELFLTVSGNIPQGFFQAEANRINEDEKPFDHVCKD